MDRFSGLGLLKSSCIFFAAVLMSFFSISSVAADYSGFNTAQCDSDLTSFIPFPYNNLPNMICKPLWNSYLLRYSQSKNNEITIVLSTIYTTGWVGIGFSRDGRMINSSCMVGWINSEGHGKIRQFYVKGFKPSEIKSGEGELPLTNAPPYVALQGPSIYLAFQLKFNKTLKTQPILLAFSTKTPHHHHLTVHDDKTTIYFDFSSGKTDNGVDDLSPSLFKNRKTHGTLALLAWGLFLPLGAIIARHLKHKDPLWYYLHLGFQFIGFLLGVAALVVGLSLDHKLHAFIPAHKGIGIFVFTLTILQVFAFITRPSTDSKYRSYWNSYHSWSGRLCLFFAAVNIVLGIHVAGAGQAWKIGYGFLLGITLVSVVILEALLRVRKKEEYHKSHTTPFSIESVEKEISL
ncbi:cytochrome b561/ferric reductase transmembrane [Striga asiatica]|uniref:Cytochrome b561/ferric reductase transmembrane n=1 Tax=Striga asiatica TaxID=4170 RepID=A0A5A7QNE7_STRAF|nr:cytochrome b561/ferric reductase transmembrane [Striga asiatica]